MKIAKRVLLFTLVLGLAVTIFSAVSPRAARAVVATLVQVANTSSNPVITSNTEDPGRIPFVSGFSNLCSGTLCSYTFQPVAAGHRVVLQHVSAALIFDSTPASIFGFVSFTGGSQIQFNVPPISGAVTVFDQPVLFYFDAGQTPFVQFQSTATFTQNVAQNLTLVGYELDCAAAPCEAVAAR